MGQEMTRLFYLVENADREGKTVRRRETVRERDREIERQRQIECGRKRQRVCVWYGQKANVQTH